MTFDIRQTSVNRFRLQKTSMKNSEIEMAMLYSTRLKMTKTKRELTAVSSAYCRTLANLTDQ